MINGIFISYRRDDSAGYAGHLFENLSSRFGQDRVFMDVATIEPGAEFEEIIKKAIATCSVLIAIIGKRWASIVDNAGCPRLHDPRDLVRLEITTALDFRVRVIPVLVDNATMPCKEDLPDALARLAERNALEISSSRWDFDTERLMGFLASLTEQVSECSVDDAGASNLGAGPEQNSAAHENPFTWRGGITDPAAFFDRDNEQRVLRDYLKGRQNCQIVGPRRGGKTSLLRQVERLVTQWCAAAKVAYLDLQDPRCATLSGWLHRVGRGFGWPETPADLTDFADGVDGMLAQGYQPVICLDEFGEIALRSTEFARPFLLTLRFCGQQGMSIFTTARKRLSELTDPGDQTSPFFNTFPILKLGCFASEDAADYVSLPRAGVAPFSAEEKRVILGFAKGHPLALQVACFHVIEAKRDGKGLFSALQDAEDDLRALLFPW